MLDLVVDDGVALAPAVRTKLRRQVARMVRAAALTDGKRDYDVVLRICDDAAIHELNRAWRGKNKPTDVLAFAMREGDYAELAGDMLGDVIVSLDTAARQAKEKKHPLDREITMLVAHGLLHLLGYDHATRTEERRMTARTDALIAAAIASRRPKRR